jgi:hypothetical protein
MSSRGASQKETDMWHIFFISCTIFEITEESYGYGCISEPVKYIIQNIFENILINFIMQENYFLYI